MHSTQSSFLALVYVIDNRFATQINKIELSSIKTMCVINRSNVQPHFTCPVSFIYI